jgi:hypothetical protein
MASGYLGFTSFSAVYEETQISLSRLQGSQATPSVSEDQSLETSVLDAFTLKPRTRDACLFVLRNVPEPSRGKICLRGSPCEAWVVSYSRRRFPPILVMF